MAFSLYIHGWRFGQAKMEALQRVQWDQKGPRDQRDQMDQRDQGPKGPKRPKGPEEPKGPMVQGPKGPKWPKRPKGPMFRMSQNTDIETAKHHDDNEFCDIFSSGVVVSFFTDCCHHKGLI